VGLCHGLCKKIGQIGRRQVATTQSASINGNLRHSSVISHRVCMCHSMMRICTDWFEKIGTFCFAFGLDIVFLKRRV